MERMLSIEFPITVYDITSGGNASRTIFPDNKDHADYFEGLIE